MYSKQGGFTLIELMMVAAIIAILACIGIPSYQSYVVKAKEVEPIVLARTSELDDKINCALNPSACQTASPNRDKCYVVGDSGTVEVECP